jgi:prepilin-type N-terminal cleavage/methylation domain-containing protein
MFVMRSRRGLAPAARARGFSLIELMVAMVLGLIVVAAVVNLVMSIIQSNNQTIQATRLTQELRATASVIAADIKRARTVEDPFRQPQPINGTPANPNWQVDATTPGCVKYSYYNSNPSITNYSHSISLSPAASSPRAVMLQSGASIAAVGCGQNSGQRLNSPFINISRLEFDRNGRRITITLTGSLVDDPEIERTLTQTIFIRSLAGS